MIKISWRTKVKCAAIPGIMGAGILYLLPGIAVLYYMVIDNVFEKNFVGLGNIQRILTNEYFQIALRNTVQMLLLCLVCTTVLALVLALPGVLVGRHWMMVGILLLLPFFMPSVISADFWKNGIGLLPPQLLLIGLFVSRNTGAVFLIIETGCLSVGRDIMDAAKIDGADKPQLFRYLILPQLPAYLGIGAVFSVMQFFAIFREAYLLFETSYPPEEVYLLQHYMFNHFHKLNYPLLSASGFLFTLFLIIVMMFAIWMVKMLQRKREYDVRGNKHG